MAFAVGTHSQAICDRCGFQYPYLSLMKEWNGLMVCPQCYEPKQPQLNPPYNRPDPQALQNPRPDRPNTMTVFVGAPGNSSFTSVGMQPSVVEEPLIIGSRIGRITVSIVNP